jgi:putative cell wall-binding protein
MAKRSRLVALCAALVCLSLVPGQAAAHGGDDGPDFAPETERVLDITFPVAGEVHYRDTYTADRSGGARKHQATDIVADKLQRIHAAASGRVCYLRDDGGLSGYMLTVCGDDGLRYSYIHLNNDAPGTDDGAGGRDWAFAPGIEEGAEVDRGQHLGYIGDSGNSEWTTAHLHFSITDPELSDPALVEPYDSNRLNPYPSLRAAEERGDLPPAEAGPPADGELGDGGDPGALDDGATIEDPGAELPDASETAKTPPVDGSGSANGSGEAPPSLPEWLPPGAETVTAGVGRLAGPARVETSVELSQTRDSARTVIIAPATSHVEALLSAPLAGMLDAPVLLSHADGLSPEVADEVDRLGARNAYLVGSTEQLSETIRDDLADAGISAMARLSEDDRYALSARIAREMASYPGVDGFSRMLVARGGADQPSRAWPDTLSAGSLAAETESPILLSRPAALPESTTAVLDEFAPDEVSIVGGPAAVSEGVALDVASATVTTDLASDAATATVKATGTEVDRLGGANRYETSVAVARAGLQAGLSTPSVWLATGRKYPDALAAGPSAALRGVPVLLVDGTDPDGAAASRTWLSQRRGSLDGATVVGGPAVVNGEAAEAVSAALE